MPHPLPLPTAPQPAIHTRQTHNVPLCESFLVLIILAANSNPVDFCTHLRTIENAPLKIESEGMKWDGGLVNNTLFVQENKPKKNA